jgi:hypothetical protein
LLTLLTIPLIFSHLLKFYLLINALSEFQCTNDIIYFVKHQLPPLFNSNLFLFVLPTYVIIFNHLLIILYLYADIFDWYILRYPLTWLITLHYILWTLLEWIIIYFALNLHLYYYINIDMTKIDMTKCLVKMFRSFIDMKIYI